MIEEVAVGDNGGVGADPAALTRCREAVDAVASGVVAAPDLPSFVAGLACLPAWHPHRGELAATMVTLLTKGGGAPPMSAMGHLGALLDMVDVAPPHLLAWPRARAAARAFQLAHEVQHRAAVGAAVMAELDELTARHVDFPPTVQAIETARKAVQLNAAFERGDDSSAAALAAMLERMAHRVGDAPQAGSLREMSQMLQELLRAQRTGDLTEVPRLLDRMRDSAADLGIDPTTLMMPAGHEEILRLLTGGEPDVSGLDPNEIIRKSAGDGPGAEGKLAASYVLMRGGDETDLDRIGRAIELTREAAAVPGAFQDLARNGLAINLWRRAEVLGTTEGLDEARQVLEDLVEHLRGRGGSAHPMWDIVHHLLEQVTRRVGDQRGSGAAGLEAMYRFAHRALVESDPAVARTSLRDVAALGMDFARHRLIEGDYAGALDALDTGRGLMLFAEVELLDLAPRLRVAGRDDLARRWEVEGPAAPGLRAESIEVLVAAEGGIDTLLRSPLPADVRTALATVDADALVYLVPADQQQPGMALVVPRDRPMAHLLLPHLSVRQEAEGYLTALSRLSRELEPAARAPFTDSLDGLCEWAWRVAIGPLLERYFARDAEKRGRVPRIVLIPMAELAAIPWQAARNREGTYAVELAAFSHAVSAREFCANAARPPVRLTSTGLVVGDPGTAGPARDLPAARQEAFEVHKAFLRAAKYVGRRPNGTESPSGAGTAEQVRAWLVDDRPHAGAVLHLACHGQFTSDERAAKACLLLASDTDGTPSEMGADEIVRLLHGNPERHIGLVVMAACHTGRSIHGYDEAYSLGTAFLVGGVRTVLSTQWAVPDDATSMLMYLFHHYLRTEGMRPWQALRAAQLCMLRPGTPLPGTLPAHLRALVRDGEHAGVVGWAGFIHGGH